MMKPRGVLPTMADDRRVVLCKAAPFVRDTYEIRLCLYLAKKQGCSFTLVIPPGGRIATGLASRLEEHGGLVAESRAEDFSVYCGAVDAAGVEQDGWVLGDSGALARLALLIRSEVLRGVLTVGCEARGSTLAEVHSLLQQEQFMMANVDDEDVREALLALCEQAEAEGGAVFVQ